MSKALSKEIMTRTRIKVKKTKGSIQNSAIIVYHQSACLENLNEKKIGDKNTSWKTIKSFLSDKITSTQKITLEKEEIIMGDDDTVRSKIEEYFNRDPLASNQ